MSFFMSLLAGSNSLAGCHKDRANADNANKVEAGPNVDSVKDSLDGLKPQLSAMDAKFTALHQQFDALPANLPGFGEVRARFYATDEGMGIMGPRITWLSDRLDYALKSANREELRGVSTDIVATYDQMREIDRIATELTHQISPFERMARLQELEITGGSPFTRVLPTGYEVLGAKDGVEQRLIEFIEDSKRKVDATTWFEFDRPLFQGGAAHLDIHDGVSAHQLRNVSEILQAYQHVTLKIGAYTDNTGAPADNKKLTAERANSVEEDLVRLGVAAERLDARGHGAEYPVCPANDTDACKARNRRVALLVTAK
jgi:outer membrane protein OmpA-like peptidoglycan-associated protein